eukprot:TRINITY_DN2899_c0_g1_i3.p1 TRINITY_DN2899_c0_g1~~TRINITY_DN2899_c0_g1_i3.p1  ORF type:complete len:2521 (-),score=930.00 TRINITY_DN2899_c0_g1_i3:18-7580(-)
MALPLKITIPRLNQTKLMKFAPTMSVLETLKQIKEKIGEDDAAGSDHGLFQPAMEGRRGARWLKNDRTLQYHDLAPNDELIYKKRHRTIKVKLQDGTIKTVLVDDTLTVTEISAVVGNKLSITNAEEFSLQLDEKPDDWLIETQSLHEQGVQDDAVLLYRKKYYVTEPSLTLEDPVGLHLLYVESRDAILNGKHPCTLDEAISFAALQCQAVLGNFQPLKPVKIECKDYLPVFFHKKAKEKKIEEKIQKEHKKLVGMSESNAKYRYVQLARSLKTYGITYFEVKRRVKGQKKPEPLYLGVTRDAVMFIDFETKAVESEWPLIHVKRWAAAPTTFTLDFGDHSQDYTVFLTNDAEKISALLAGYIDIIIRRRKEPAIVKEDDDTKVAVEEPIAPIRSKALSSTTMSMISAGNTGNYAQYSAVPAAPGSMSKFGYSAARATPTSIESAQAYVAETIAGMGAQTFSRNMALTPQQWKKQLISNSENVSASYIKLLSSLPPNAFDKLGMDKNAAAIAMSLQELITAARNAAAGKNGEEDVDLLEGAKRLADAVKEMLASSKELAEHPNDHNAMIRWEKAQANFQAANAYLHSASRGIIADESSQKLLAESAKGVKSALEDLLAAAYAKATQRPELQLEQYLDAYSVTAREQTDKLTHEVNALAPAIMNISVRKLIEDSATSVESQLSNILYGAQYDSETDLDLAFAAKAVSDALAQLLASTKIAEAKDTSPDFASAAKDILDETARLMAAKNAEQVNESKKIILQASSKLVNAAKQAAETSDEDVRMRLHTCARAVAEAAKKLIQASELATSNMDDAEARRSLQAACQRLAEATQALAGDAGEKAALQHLRSSCKIAAATTTALVTSSKTASSTCSDPVSNENLKLAATSAAEAISTLVSTLQNTWQHPFDKNSIDLLLKQSREACPQAYKLVAASKSALPRITDANNKVILRQHADEAADALQRLVAANKQLIMSVGQSDVDAAIEAISAQEATIQAALIEVASSILPMRRNVNQEEALNLLHATAKEVAAACKRVATTSKTSPDDFGPATRVLAEAIQRINESAMDVASIVMDQNFQQEVLEAAHTLTSEARNALSTGRAVASNPSDPNLNQLLSNSAQNLADALSRLLEAAKGGHNMEKECDAILQAFSATVKRFVPERGDSREFSSNAQDLENSIRAVQNAIFNLVNSAKTNPKAFPAAAKMVIASVNSLTDNVSKTSGSCTNGETQKFILDAGKAAMDALSKLVRMAKDIHNQEGSSAMEELTLGGDNVAAALQKLLAAVNSAAPGQKGMEEALDVIRVASQREYDPYGQKDSVVYLDELKRSAARLGESIGEILTSSRTNPERMGGMSKDAAASVAIIIESANGLSNAMTISVYDALIEAVKKHAKDLTEACQSKEPSVRQMIVPSAKEASLKTALLVEQVRMDVSQSADDDAIAHLSQIGQNIATATGELVKAAKSNSPEKIQEAHAHLLERLDALEAYGDRTLSSKAEKLIQTANDTTFSTAKVIECAKAVLRKSSDVTVLNDLSAAAKAARASILALIEAAKSVGQIDLDPFTELLAAAILELDTASFNASVGLLEASSSSKTTQQLEEDLVNISKDLATSIVDLVRAKESPSTIGLAAKKTTDPVTKMTDISKQLASVTANPEKQQLYLSSVKSIAEAALSLMEACKTGDSDNIGVNAKTTSQAIAKLISSLKGGVLALRDCDEASKAVMEGRRVLDASKTGVKQSYVTCQRELIGQCKELVAGIAKLTNSAKTAPGEVGTHAKAIAASIETFGTWTVNTIASSSDQEAQNRLTEAARRVFNATNKIIQAAKFVSSDSKSQKNQQAMSSSYKEVTDSISSLVAAIKSGATGELKCEAALDQITRMIGELDSAALNAATGQLQVEDDDVDIEELQSMLTGTLTFVNQESTKIIQGAKADQNLLGDAASDAASVFDRLVKETKSMAAMLNSLLSQQDTLNGAKAIGLTLQSLISAGLQHPVDMSNLSNCQVKMEEATGEFSNLVQQAGASANAGIKELESARKSTISSLENYDKQDSTFISPNAGASDVLRCAKSVADSVAVIQATCGNSAGNSQESEKLIKAANEVSTASRDLLKNVRGVKRLTDDAHGAKLTSTARNVVENLTNFLEASKNHKKQMTGDTFRGVSEAAEEVVRSIGDFVESSRSLPDSEEALRLFQETDELEALAEKELMNAAKAINDAARTLAQAKERQLQARKNGDTPLPEEEIAEAIIDSAKAITSATSVLVVAATAAQKELVAQGRASKQQSMYRRDPAWAKGLISAAQSVAGTVKDLVTAANDASQGKAEEEVLIASAKGVAAATARLVFASRAKADPFSNAQKQLSTAARGVAGATQRLVEAAKYSSQLDAEQDAKPDWEGATQTEKRKQEMDVQVNILVMEKKLEQERVRLANLRKDEYKTATAAPLPPPVMRTPSTETSSLGIPPPPLDDLPPPPVDDLMPPPPSDEILPPPPSDVPPPRGPMGRGSPGRLPTSPTRGVPPSRGSPTRGRGAPPGR